jgi:AcrR family transcriptional regulator
MARPAAAKPVRKSRKEQAVETRARLKEATKTALGRIGWRQLRIADVTQEAGVAVGLFYHYFPDLKAAVTEVLSDFMQEMTLKAHALPHGGDLFETLRDQFTMMLGHFEAHPGLMRCMLQASDEIPEFGEIWKASNRQWSNSFARFIGECLGKSKPDNDTLVLIAYSLGSMSDGIMQELYVQQNPDVVSRVRSKEAAAELMAGLIYRTVYLADPPTEKFRVSRPIGRG